MAVCLTGFIAISVPHFGHVLSIMGSVPSRCDSKRLRRDCVERSTLLCRCQVDVAGFPLPSCLKHSAYPVLDEDQMW